MTQDYFWPAASWREPRDEKRNPAKAAGAFERHGTVGAVARDAAGHLAWATSTGGLTNELVGRIGDPPLLGAGTYADDRSVAVSATGAGEAFIRANAAADISCLMRYRGWGVGRAARLVVLKDVPSLDGDGGVIALDRRARLATPPRARGSSTPT